MKAQGTCAPCTAASRRRRQPDTASIAVRVFPTSSLTPRCCLQAMGNAHAALSCYRSSLRLNPAHAVQHYRLGNSLMGLQVRLGRRRSEILSSQTTVASRNMNPSTQPHHAALPIWSGEDADPGPPQEFGRARASYLLATVRMPQYGDAYNNLGNCLMNMARCRPARTSPATRLSLASTSDIAAPKSRSREPTPRGSNQQIRRRH